MQIVEKLLFFKCIDTMVNVLETLKDASVSTLIEETDSGKKDSLYIDVLPENILKMKLIQDFDRYIVLVTEERGRFNFSEINTAEVVVFSDPTDRSKPIKNFIIENIKDHKINKNSHFRELIDSKTIRKDWETYDKFPPRLSGATSSITIIKKNKILFSIILNYITQEIFAACDEFTGYKSVKEIKKSKHEKSFASWKKIKFVPPTRENKKKYVTYLGKTYYDKLKQSLLLDTTYTPLDDEPGGPARIFYVSNLNKSPAGFVFSNGEKIGEWLCWLAFCKFTSDLTAYSIYPKTFFAKDDILMTPSPPYSILEFRDNDLFINYDKLKYFSNPSKYREMILISHRDNQFIRARVEAKKSRQLF